MMKQSHTKYIYFSFFNPLKVTDKLEIKSFRMSPWGQTRWGQKCYGAKQVHSMRPYLKHNKYIFLYFFVQNPKQDLQGYI